MASGAEKGATFHVINASAQDVYSATVGAKVGKWSNQYPYLYVLDFSGVTTPGAYTISVTGKIAATSPSFQIDTDANLYTGLLANADVFYRGQRDGSNVDSAVLNRQPSHLTDTTASIYATPTFQNGVLKGSLTNIGGPVDVSGGWFDAGDYLKFVETTSYTEGVLLIAVREAPGVLSAGSTDFATEAKVGLDWLLKMWDDNASTLYIQVGIGDGNGTSILGDHDFWRLPEDDDAMNAQPADPGFYVEYRPVFRAGAPGSQISPNLAGRMAASFALGYQLYRISDPSYAAQCLRNAEHIFDLAATSVSGPLVTVAPFDFYPETEWREDLEWGAAELYFATAGGGLPPGLPHTDPQYYLQAAAQWAHAYITGPNDGADSLNLYDTSGLAHFELYNALTQAGNPSGLAATQNDLLTDLKAQLDQAVSMGNSDPFGLGYGITWGDVTPHALGLSMEAILYDELAQTTAYAAFAQRQLDFVLGANAWGASFVVGAGSGPQCMQHQIANLAGSLDGTPPLLLGAVVDGPQPKGEFKGLGTPDGARACPVDGIDLYKNFAGKKARYMDNVISWPTVEPALDYTVLTVLLFSWQIQH